MGNSQYFFSFEEGEREDAMQLKCLDLSSDEFGFEINDFLH